MATGVRGCMAPRGIVTHAVSTAAAARSPLLRAPSLAAVATPPRHVTSPVSLQPSARRSLTRSAYGASQSDGTWEPIATNAFGNLINLAKGQREIVQAGTPCLRDIAAEVPVKDIDSAEIQETIQEMLGICRGRGVGLAAPQIGVAYRIFVLEDTEEGMSDVGEEELAAQERTPFAAKVVVNPVVTPAGNASAAFFEGCLSVQGYRGLVRRWLQVRVTGLGGDGTPVDFIAKGWQARIVQHEMDHLNGVLYIDRMDTRTFRRLDKLDEPLPPAHPEFGAAPALGVCEGGGGVKVGGRSGGSREGGAMGADDVEGFLGLKKQSGKKRRSR